MEPSRQKLRHAGTYEVKVSVHENGDFAAASDAKSMPLSQK